MLQNNNLDQRNKVKNMVEGIVLDIQRSFDSSVIASLVLLILVVTNTHEIENFEDLSHRLSASYPLLGTLFTSMFVSGYYNLKFMLKRNKFQRLMKYEMLNGQVNIDSFLTPLDKLSLFQLFVYLKHKLKPMESSDFEAELNHMISFFIEN